MIDAMTATQITMLQDELRLQSISQNIANMQTPGYKRQILESKGFAEQLQVNMATVSQQMQTHALDYQGSLVQSKRPLDIALAGEGYFEVQTNTGVSYTRRGDFHVNEEGELSTATGAKLLGKNGTIRVDDNPFTIDANGAVFIDYHKIDQINVVQFSKPHLLHTQGNGLFESQENPRPVNSKTRVLQGYLEQSNVKSIDEMMEMVKTSRHFETSQRIIHTADSLLSTAIHELGTTS